MKILNDNLNKINKNDIYPMIPLREMIIFPGMKKTFYVGRKESVEAVNIALSEYHNYIFLSTQKKTDIENPELEDLYPTGVIAVIKKVSPGPDKNIIRILIHALDRGKMFEIIMDENVKKVRVEKINAVELDNSVRSEALLNLVIKEFKKFVTLTKLSADVIKQIMQAENEDMLINLIIPYLKASQEKRLDLLNETDITKRMTILSELITANIDIILMEKKINFEVRKKIDKSQKEYYLNEQIKEIQKELGYPNDNDNMPLEDFAKKLDDLGITEPARSKALKEQSRLLKMPPLSPEAGVIRVYLDSLLDLPWTNKTEDSHDLKLAKKILDTDHYSLQKVKNRILEFLAVRQLNPKTKGPILCFVGPPGTGKTSLGKSVARAIGREFVRVSLGGVRDEAEIRGHRRTYLGALPGKMIQSMKKAKTINPVFLLDEIDKLSSDFRGDPASALLEVLDPEQNSQFVDHYLEVPYDLSNVMFITTANSKQGIPYPLLDRMEIIYISGYTEVEKLNITKKFLLPKEKCENGINDITIKISDATILEIIRSYTMEAGVRSLQRQIASIYRKIAKRLVINKDKTNTIIVNKKNLAKYLGNKKFIQPIIDKELDIGEAHGLAWSEIGGSILPIEVVLYPGTGKVILTGKLGEVMKESAQTAFSYIRANAYRYDIKYKDFYKKFDVHVHFPEGAIPKDGPSAGIAITCGILSALTKVPMHSKYAMTGEITLTGKVLPIGGLKEKSLAASRHNKEKIIIPFENEKDLEEIPTVIKQKMEFIKVKRASEVFALVFDEKIYQKPKKDKTDTKKNPSESTEKVIIDQNFDNIITQ